MATFRGPGGAVPAGLRLPSNAPPPQQQSSPRMLEALIDQEVYDAFSSIAAESLRGQSAPSPVTGVPTARMPIRALGDWFQPPGVIRIGGGGVLFGGFGGPGGGFLGVRSEDMQRAYDSLTGVLKNNFRKMELMVEANGGKPLPHRALMAWLMRKLTEMTKLLEMAKAGTEDSLGKGTLQEKSKWWSSDEATDFMIKEVYPVICSNNDAGKTLYIIMNFLTALQMFLVCTASVEDIKAFPRLFR